jgi:hypothetical protein
VETKAGRVRRIEEAVFSHPFLEVGVYDPWLNHGTHVFIIDL